MAIEMQLHITSDVALQQLFSYSWKDFIREMEGTNLRGVRPPKSNFLDRGFDIDLEAEILDWVEQNELTAAEGDLNVIQVISGAWRSGQLNSTSACEGLMNLMKWASFGQWKVMEGRVFLYLNPVLFNPAEDIQELYSDECWMQVKNKLPQLIESEYCEKVVIQWMKMRSDIGETLDEKSDPRILSTMQSHMKYSSQLHHLVSKWRSSEDYSILLGGDHIVSTEWRHKGASLREILKQNSQ